MLWLLTQQRLSIDVSTQARSPNVYFNSKLAIFVESIRILDLLSLSFINFNIFPKNINGNQLANFLSSYV